MTVLTQYPICFLLIINPKNKWQELQRTNFSEMLISLFVIALNDTPLSASILYYYCCGPRLPKVCRFPQKSPGEREKPAVLPPP